MENTQSFNIPESLAVSDSGFLFLASSGETFTLNPVGKEIFAMIKGGASVASIKEHFLAAYDVELPTLERDLDDFLSQLKNFKLVNK